MRADAGNSNNEKRGLRLQLALFFCGECLDGGEEAHEIAAEELVQIGGGVAASEQGGGDPGQIGGRVDLFGEGRDSVEVRTDTDVVDAGDADDMVEVGDKR
jgi:hypothetical protein